MLRQRFGTFFLVIGLAMVGLFILSDASNQPQFGLFFLGVVGVLGGVVLWWRAPTRSALPPKPSGRFRLVRSLVNRSKPRKK